MIEWLFVLPLLYWLSVLLAPHLSLCDFRDMLLFSSDHEQDKVGMENGWKDELPDIKADILQYCVFYFITSFENLTHGCCFTAAIQTAFKLCFFHHVESSQHFPVKSPFTQSHLHFLCLECIFYGTHRYQLSCSACRPRSLLHVN